MTNIAGNKLINHLDRVAGDRRPITADVFLDNYCNNRCPYCTYSRWEHEPGARAMSYEDFSRYSLRLMELGVRGIILTGGGEPMLAPDFDKITAWLDAIGMPYGINTNLNVLKTCKPEYLKVSLDGYDEDSYEKSRGVRKYYAVRENIKAYADWKRGNSPSTSLGIQKVCASVDEVLAFYRANKDLPVDYMVFRPMESTRGQYYMIGSKRREAEKIIEMVKTISDDDPRVVLNFKWNMLGMSFEKCVAHWSQMAINEKGEVMYCCHKPFQIVGHIMDDDILEKHARAHTDMNLCDIPCRLTAPNLFMSQVERGTKNPSFI